LEKVDHVWLDSLLKLLSAKTAQISNVWTVRLEKTSVLPVQKGTSLMNRVLAKIATWSLTQNARDAQNPVLKQCVKNVLMDLD
jgi:hypothetical protein